MAGPAARLRGEGVDQLGVQRGRFARRQVVGEDDDRILEVGGRSLVAQEMLENGLLDIEQIRAARAERGVVEVLERLGVAAHDPADGVGGRVELGRDKLLDLADQLGVLDQEGVGGKDGPVLLAELGRDVLLGLARLQGAAGEGGPQPNQLVGDLGAGDRPARYAQSFGVNHQGGADGHAGGDGNPAFDFHVTRRCTCD